jgi:hypothetical protein
VSEPELDPERLAALLDGRVDDKERAELVARLAASPEARAVLADAAAVVDVLPQNTVGTTLPSKGEGERGRLFRRTWLALAASVIVVVGATTVYRTTRGRSLDPGDYIALLANQSSGLPPSLDIRPWGATRSSTQPVTEPGRAYRLGARLTDLSLMVPRRDTLLVPLSLEAAALLVDVPVAGDAVHAFRQLAAATAEPNAPLEPLFREARSELTTLGNVDQDRVRYGAWLEAARVAGARQDTAFFRKRESRQVLTDLARKEGDSVELQPLIKVAQSSIENRDWSILAPSLSKLLALLGR